MNTAAARQGLFAMLCVVLGGCASVPVSGVQTPEVRLTHVECTGFGFSNQTFVLSFNVKNPNPFDLPVSAVSYGLKLEGKRFASGQTSGSFVVPALGSREYAISVDLNLLSTSPELLAAVREGVREQIDYELKGRFVLGLPGTDAVRYRHAGNVQLRGSARSFLTY